MIFVLPRRLAVAAAGFAVACGIASQARADDPIPPPAPAPLPCPEPCGPSRVICAPTPKVIVEVPPPNVVIRAAAACSTCAPKESIFQKICHHCKPTLVQPQAFVQPMAVQPQAFVQPHVFVQPVAPQFVQPQAFVQPQVFAQPQFVQPVAPQFVQPQAPQFVQPQVVHLMVSPAAVPPAAVPPAAVPPVASGETCDAALRRVTSQMETLTKVVDTHTQVLISHEQRLKRLEDWAAKASADRVLPMTLPDLPALPK